MEARELPGGTVTLLFTDIEGSTRMLQELGREAYVRALTAHRRVLREAFTARGGVEVEMQGDSFFFAFPAARDAVTAAAAGQRVLHEYSWESEPIRVRIGLHTGEPMQADGLYAGLDVHQAARVMSAGHGGQVLVSRRTAAALGGALPDEFELVELGFWKLKDFPRAEELYQLVAPGLPRDFPPPRASWDRSASLPAPPTPLVGREPQLERACDLLRREGVRLLTLTGPGGTGKTRLALAVAEQLAREFADGAQFVQLAALSDAALVRPTVASALGLAADADLEDALTGRELLLVLDNFEHLLEASPQLSALVQACPGLTVLVTSRAPLRLEAEFEFEVPPLTESESIALLRARLSAHAPVDDVDETVLAEVAQRLEGLPLALELAAARARVLGVEGLRARLERALPLLTGGSRDAPERQRTLRATIAWSDELLDGGQRRLFARLSVFAGGFTLDAAEQACEASLDELEALVDHALIRRRDGVAGEPRFFMLRVIREYAAERMATLGEADEIARRHAELFVAFAERAGPEFRGDNELEWQARGAAELDNFRASLAFLLESGLAASALRLASAVYPLWWLRGHTTEARAWLERGLRAPDLPDAVRADALYRVGMLQHQQGSDEQARTSLEEALALYVEVDDRKGIAVVRGRLGAVEGRAGQHARAVEHLAESLRLMRELDDRLGVAGSLLNLGDCVLMLGDESRALALALEAHEVFRELDEPQGMAVALMNAALVELMREDWDAAARLVRVSLEHARTVDYRLGEVYAAEALAAIALGRDDAELACRLLGKAEALRKAIEVELEPNERMIHERTVQGAGRLLGDERALSLQREGRALPGEELDRFAAEAAPLTVVRIP